MQTQDWHLEIDVSHTDLFWPAGTVRSSRRDSRRLTHPMARTHRPSARTRHESGARRESRHHGSDAADGSGEGDHDHDAGRSPSPEARHSPTVHRANDVSGQRELRESASSVKPSRIESMWTVHDVAAFLKKSPRWVYEEAAAPPDDPLRIPCTRIGGNLRFDPARVVAWAKAGVPSRSARSPRRNPDQPDQE